MSNSLSRIFFRSSLGKSITFFQCHIQWCVTIFVSGIDISIVIDEDSSDINIVWNKNESKSKVAFGWKKNLVWNTVVYSDMQWPISIIVCHIWVSAVFNEEFGHVVSTWNAIE